MSAGSGGELLTIHRLLWIFWIQNTLDLVLTLWGVQHLGGPSAEGNPLVHGIARYIGFYTTLVLLKVLAFFGGWVIYRYDSCVKFSLIFLNIMYLWIAVGPWVGAMVVYYFYGWRPLPI